MIRIALILYVAVSEILDECLPAFVDILVKRLNARHDRDNLFDYWLHDISVRSGDVASGADTSTFCYKVDVACHIVSFGSNVSSEQQYEIIASLCSLKLM